MNLVFAPHHLSAYKLVSKYIVALNGPELGEADEVLKESLDLHFTKSQYGWHFTTNTLFKTSGKTVDTLLKNKNKFNIY